MADERDTVHYDGTEGGWGSVRGIVETGERRFGSVAITGVNALDIRRLAPQPSRV